MAKIITEVSDVTYVTLSNVMPCGISFNLLFMSDSFVNVNIPITTILCGLASNCNTCLFQVYFLIVVKCK